MSQIHATLEQGLRLKNAGWKADCIFTAHFDHYYPEDYEYKDLQYNVFSLGRKTNRNLKFKDISRYESDKYLPPQNEEMIPLPTLGEIDLPECVCVIKRPSGTYHIYTDGDLELDTPALLSFFVAYETELEARIEAYIWAKTNLPTTE